jgi:hypothetical protein
MKKIYNIEMWQDLISILDISDFELLESPYLCDNSDEFEDLFYEQPVDGERCWEHLKLEAEEFLKTWKDDIEWEVSYRYLFGIGDSITMCDISRTEKVPVRLAFCKYMLQKSLEYEGNQTES